MESLDLKNCADCGKEFDAGGVGYTTCEPCCDARAEYWWTVYGYEYGEIEPPRPHNTQA